MTADQDHPTTAEQPDAQPEHCSGCAATLAEDQRYCLHCGARRGKPRIDFTAFWKPLSPTAQTREQLQARSTNAADGGSRSPAGLPSRRVAAATVAGVLAIGILAGAALGPRPASSPAEDATLAQHALVALASRASGDSPASATTSSTAATSEREAATTPVEPSPAHSKTKTASKAAPNEANTPPPVEGSSSESSTSSPSSEGSPSEGSSSKGAGEGEKTAPGTPIKLPPIKHVWLIALSGVSFANALAQAQTDPYLAKQLVPKGTLLSDFTLSASSELANNIALLSGQGVNLDTEQNCPTYTEVQPQTISATNGLTEGVGCVYPHEVQTLADELTAAGMTWKAYVQDMEEGAPSAGGATPSNASPTTGSATQTPAASVTCRHPELGATDLNQAPAPGDPYLTFSNPFVYFHSLLDGGACASNDIDLSQLQGSLATPASTPALSWIVPSACNDGSSTPCAPSAATGLGPADSFLKEVVPQILATTAYRKEGLIVIVPDSAPGTSASAATKPVGALLISPFVHGGAHLSGSFDDFSLLKSLARLFGVLPLGHANDPSTVSFGATVYRTTK
jgi:hypothetical protein